MSRKRRETSSEDEEAMPKRPAHTAKDLRVKDGYLLFQELTNEATGHAVKLIPLEEFTDKELLQIAHTPLLCNELLCNEESGLDHLTLKEFEALQTKLHNYGYTPEEIAIINDPEPSTFPPKREFVVSPADLRENRVVLALVLLDTM